MHQLYRSSMSIHPSQHQHSVRRRPAKAAALGLWMVAACSLPVSHSVPYPQAPVPNPAPESQPPAPPAAVAAAPPAFEPIAAPAPGDPTTATTATGTGKPVKPTDTGAATTTTKTNVPVLPTNTLPPINTNTTTTTQSMNPVITVQRPTITTTTTTTSSSSKTTIAASTRAFPTESPYGQVIGPDKNGNLMLTVSLVVVFAVLAGMGLVVFCLFKRRSAKRRMHLFGGKGNGSDSPLGSNNNLGEMLATASAKEASNGGSVSGDRTGRDSGTIGTAASDMDIRKSMLQEMSERHHSALLSRRSSTLSIGAPPLQNASMPMGTPHSAPLQMLSPTLMPTRPNSSYALDPNASGTSLADYRNMNRNSQYEEYYGGSSLGPVNPPFIYGASNSSGSRPGSVSYSGSHEQLLMRPTSVTLSRRSSLSPGMCPPQPQTPEMQGLPTRSKTISVVGAPNGYPTAPQPQYAHSTTMPSPLSGPVSTAGYHRGSFITSSSDNLMASTISSSSVSPDRRQSSAVHSSSSIRSEGSSGEDDSQGRPQPRQHSNLVIPPSITTRPRSSVGMTNSMYGSPGMGSGYYQPPPPPMPQQQQQYPHYAPNGSGAAYYSQPLPYADGNTSYPSQQPPQQGFSSPAVGPVKNTGGSADANSGSATGGEVEK